MAFASGLEGGFCNGRGGVGGSTLPFSKELVENLEATADTLGNNRAFLRRRKMTVVNMPMKTLARIRTIPMNKPRFIPCLGCVLPKKVSYADELDAEHSLGFVSLRNECSFA